jgi:hypothetical protein
MELKNFVAETLKQIIEGVVSSQRTARESGAQVNPGRLASVGGLLYSSPGGTDSVQMVDFDISLTESRGDEAKGGIGVFFGSVGLGAQGKSETGTSAMNRVKFSIPIMFPMQKS